MARAAHLDTQQPFTAVVTPKISSGDAASGTSDGRSLLKSSSTDEDSRSAGPFRSCLAAIKGLRTVYPGAGDYRAASAVWNLRIAVMPTGVVYPKSASQVSAVVKCCVRHGKQPVPRGGGHSYAGVSTLLSTSPGLDCMLISGYLAHSGGWKRVSQRASCVRPERGGRGGSLLNCNCKRSVRLEQEDNSLKRTHDHLFQSPIIIKGKVG